MAKNAKEIVRKIRNLCTRGWSKIKTAFRPNDQFQPEPPYEEHPAAAGNVNSTVANATGGDTIRVVR
ncbi:hypothetical protein HYFRA_00005867 [Hymenoscyphus fraxineus]|uniref:Uncharacterized protein n=1 Tax=Hymenoscyphus fraxineus TaxID=746836 RepID=A0A9N9PU80_9HELO|nr:hypothetical protein HYFRA_00005867 [Hymenoscyphus fraxineus]